MAVMTDADIKLQNNEGEVKLSVSDNQSSWKVPVNGRI